MVKCEYCKQTNESEVGGCKFCGAPISEDPMHFMKVIIPAVIHRDNLDEIYASDEYITMVRNLSVPNGKKIPSDFGSDDPVNDLVIGCGLT